MSIDFQRIPLQFLYKSTLSSSTLWSLCLVSERSKSGSLIQKSLLSKKISFIYLQELDDRLFINNSIFNILWATGFLIFWRRKQAELAYEWNTLDMEQLEETRAAYKGQLRRSPVTDKDELHYPSWKRLLFRLFVTIPLLVINLVLVSFFILIIIRFQSWIDRQLKSGRLPRKSISIDHEVFSIWIFVQHCCH